MEDTRARWDKAYAEAHEYDIWGQVEEAVEGYNRLQAATTAEYEDNVLQLPLHRREGIGKLAAVLKLRVLELRTSRDHRVGLAAMKSIKPWMKSVIVSDAAFPIKAIDAASVLGITPKDDAPQPQEVSDTTPTPAIRPPSPPPDGTLRGPPTGLVRGDVTLELFVEKWGLKDATNYIEPRVAVSAWDSNGKMLEAQQETPVAKHSKGTYVFFEVTVHLQTPLNRLPPDAAIFLEFKHWKPSKRKKSVKAYCFLELEEIRNGPVTLEVYKKPTDTARKRKPALLSVKPLYLHLNLSLSRR